MASRDWMCRAALALAVLAAGGCSGLPALRRPPNTTTPISVRVQLSMVNVRGETYDLMLGSGFLINAEGHVVTAAHMVEYARNYFPIKPTAHFTVVLPPRRARSEPVGSRTLDASLVLEDTSLDLAVLQIDADEVARPRPWWCLGSRVGMTQRDVPRLRLDAPPVGAAIVLAGYPEDATSVVESEGHLLDERILDRYRVDAGTPRPPFATLLDHAVYLVDAPTEPGESGSPVYLAGTREVIGVCVSILQLLGDGNPDAPEPSMHAGERATLVVQARMLAKLLDAHEIPWRPSP
jgi:S1-C subfamily serine protease